MRSLFVEDSVDMGRELGIVGHDVASDIRDSVSGRYVCPFCGAVREQSDGVCPRCTMESTAATRQATKSRIGPWYVLQTRNPAAPGMKYETLLAFVGKGRVKARSIVRGPTTQQLWRFAAHVRGLSREFGICYSCGEPVSKTANLCPHCNRPQDPPANPDVFLESAEAERTMVPPAPVYREIGATPLVAEDLTGPAGSAPAKADPKAGPVPMDSDPRALKKGADGFLTAADLAAAFKLDFQQPKGRKQKKTSVAPIAMDRESPTGRPRRKRRWFRAVLLLLLAASIGAAAYQYRHDPVFHTRADRWYAVASVWTKQKWVEVKESVAKMRESQSAKSKASGQLPMIVTPATTESSHDSQSPQTTQPGVKPSPWDQIYNQPTTGSSTAPNPPAKVDSRPTNDAGSSVTIEPPPTRSIRDGGIDDVRALYRAAIEADGQGDYATAVKKYEQIKEYSKDLWPRDLDLRLKSARDQLH